MLSLVQNFVCNLPERLEVLRHNTPKLARLLQEYDFFINYNTTNNQDEIIKLYFENVSKLNFYNELNSNWALVTLSLVNEVTTPYVMYLCEDEMVNTTPEFFQNMLNEFINIEKSDYLLLCKIGKYLLPKYRYIYEEKACGYVYYGRTAPHKRLSVEAIYRTEFFKDRLEEFLLHKDECLHDIPYRKENLPNYYEGYYDFGNGTKRFSNLKCYLPKEPIFVEYTEVLEK